MTELCKVCYPALQLSPPRNPNIFFIPSSVFHINLWSLQYLCHQPCHGVNSAAPFPCMTPLCPSQVCKEQTVFSDLPAAQRGSEPIAAGARASYGKCILSPRLFPSSELGEGVRWNVFTEGRSNEYINILKNQTKINNLSSKHPFNP